MQSFEILRQSADVPDFEHYQVPAEARRVFNQAMAEWIISDGYGFWLDPETRDGHADTARFVVQLGQRMSALCDLYNGKRSQSPIEDQLGAALLWLYVDWADFPRVDLLSGPDEQRKVFGVDDALKFYITPQAEVSGFKADFLLWFSIGNHRGGVAVECDGHAFHEKTKEQASRDKARDRAFLLAGYPVMRFSGSDIFKSPLECAAQVGEALSPILFRVSKAGGLLGA